MAIGWRGLPYYIVKSVLGPQHWRAYWREVRRSDYRELSASYLERLLRHACKNVPHYRSLGLTDGALEAFPVLTKASLRAGGARFQRDDLADPRWSRFVTSGSTGEPLEFVQDRSAADWTRASDAWYLGELLGTSQFDRGTRKTLMLWERHDAVAKPSLLNRIARFAAPVMWLNPEDALSEAKLLEFGRAICRERPAYIWAFTGALYEIARVARDHGLRLSTPRLIICSAETLHPFMRRVIEGVFGCRVYDYYGASEAGRVAGECRAGNLHTFDFSCHVEVLDPLGRPTPPGEEGRVVLTPLHNYAMPFIRYDTADVAVVGPRECPCGCSLPTLSRITGRVVEFFVSRGGALISGGRIAGLLKHCRWVVGFHILQRDIDDLLIYFTRAADVPVSQDDVGRIETEIAGALGTSCTIDWKEVEKIPRTPNGKRPYARSLVWENRQPFRSRDASQE